MWWRNFLTAGQRKNRQEVNFRERGEKAMRRFLIVMLFTVILGGCMVGPNYQRPEIDTPQAWRFEDKKAKEASEKPQP